MANSDEELIYEVPPNTEKILFAEDLVNYIIYDNTPMTEILFTAERYRNFVVNIFDDNMRTAADFLNTTLALRDDEIFQRLVRNNFVNAFYFTHYARKMKDKFFRGGFDPDRFLHYSVHLASLAANFYVYGIKDTPAIAVKYIVESMCFDPSTCGTESLDTIAQKYVNINLNQMELPTPDSEDLSPEEFEEPGERELDDGADVENELSTERISNRDNETKQQDHVNNPVHYFTPLSDNTQLSYPPPTTERQFFASASENQNSCNTSSSHLTTSDYIPVPGTSKDQGVNVIHLVPCFKSQSQKSLTPSQSKFGNSSESSAGEYRNPKKARTDAKFQKKKQDKNCEESRQPPDKCTFIPSKQITPPTSDSDN